MKLHTLVLLMLIFPGAGYMSGTVENIELKKRLDKDRPVYLVKIIGSSTVTIKELKEAIKVEDAKIADQHYYSAEIIEIINAGNISPDDEEQWTMLFSLQEKAILKKIKKNGVAQVSVTDTIFIFDREDLRYSFIYYVEGMHKIFYYYRCVDASQKIEIGKTYLFVAGKSFSIKNGVLYGNVDYGLYPDTKAMRKKITGILKKSD